MQLKKYISYFVNKNKLYYIRPQITTVTEADYFETSRKIQEAIINVDYYKDLLTNLFIRCIYKYKDKPIRFLAQLYMLLNKEYDSYNIEFKDNGQFNEDSIEKMMTDRKTLKIIIECNPMFLEEFKNKNKDLINTFNNLIAHELVHRGQAVRIDVQTVEHTALSQKVAKQKYINTLIKKQNLTELEAQGLWQDNIYLANKREVMAYAKQAIEELRFCGYDNNKIKNKLQNFTNIKEEESGIVTSYLSVFKDYKTNKREQNLLKLFLKYMYLYI